MVATADLVKLRRHRRIAWYVVFALFFLGVVSANFGFQGAGGIAFMLIFPILFYIVFLGSRIRRTESEQAKPVAISKARLILNGIGCVGIAILCLPIGFVGIIGLASTPFGTDPDGGDKVLAIEIFCGLLGAIAFISLISTVKIWRGLHEESHIVRAEREPNIPIAKGEGDNGIWAKRAKWASTVVIISFFAFLVNIALSAPQSYRIKAKMAGAVMLGQNAAVAVDNYEHEHHQLPKNLEQTGFAETLPAVVRKIAFDSQRGVVAVTMSMVPIEGKTLLMVSSKDASGKTQWKCMSQEIQKEYLPQGCRQNN